MTDQAAPDKPQAPIQRIENISLEAFEKAVYSRNYERAGVIFLESLRKLKMGAEFVGYVPEPRMKGILYTRFCSAVVTLLSDPNFKLSGPGFDHLAAEHAMTDMLFRASVYGCSDHMLPQMAANPTEVDRSKLKLEDGGALLKFLLTYSLRSAFGLNFEETFKRSPQITLPMWAGMSSALLTVAVQAFERREALLGMHGIFREAKLMDGAMPTLSDAYMYCSYGVRPDKHDMKATVHHLFYKRLREHAPTKDRIASRRARALEGLTQGRKPRLLVAAEWWTSLHAMFRCYAPIIRQLRAKYHVIGMSRAMDTDEVAKQEFDEWHEVPTKDVDLGKLIRDVTALEPDVIYYPSLGMALWWVALASLRLAPVQVMTLGHPASSRSPVMDYVIAEPECIGDPALFTEEVIPIPFGSARFIMRADATFPELEWDHLPETVEVAVPAMLCKLNAPFMKALREIGDCAAEAGKKVRFHMFINMQGLNLFQAAREIREWLPDSRVYERSSYNEYLGHLRKCQLHLCTFPFGGTNSNIDSMLLGIPIVAKEGLEPHERFDAMMVRRAGLPESLVAKSTEEYVQTAVRLIVHDDERNNLHELLLETDLEGKFFGDPPEGDRDAFARAMDTAFIRGQR